MALISVFVVAFGIVIIVLAVSHASFVVEEACCVTCFARGCRRPLCHMFRLLSKKHVVSHVSPGAEEGGGVT